MTPGAAFLAQAEACEGLGSPFMGRLLRLIGPRIARGGPVWDRIAAWPGDITGATGASVPLRLAGGLHRLVLGGDPPLAAVYPPNDPSDTVLLAAVEDAVARHAAFLDTWLDRPPQTNEVRRSAVLIAAAHLLTARHGMPLTLSEIGASAGLNLAFDRFALALDGATLGPGDPALTLAPDWRGPPPPDTPPRVAGRRGADIAPLDPAEAEDRLRLLSYLWPDQAHRLENTSRAIAAAQSLGIRIDRADAADWLAARLSRPHAGHLHLVFHTVAWQYFPPGTRSRAEAALAAAGAEATGDARLARLALEPDGDIPGAAIRLTEWPGGETRSLGRADFHGRWVDWRPNGV